MKAILISDHAKWCALMMNGIKKSEVRKENVGKAVKKLIDENGHAEIYVYCSKGKDLLYKCINDDYDCDNWKVLENRDNDTNILNGKVVFKFRCYKVDKIELKRVNDYSNDTYEYMTDALSEEELLKETCLHTSQLGEYLEGKTGYAIRISDLEILDEPKEISEFYTIKCNQKKEPCNIKDVFGAEECHRLCKMCKPLTKAPQSMVYVEVE